MGSPAHVTRRFRQAQVAVLVVMPRVFHVSAGSASKTVPWAEKNDCARTTSVAGSIGS